jgi:hypothetical protein
MASCYRISGFGITNLVDNDDRLDRNGYLYSPLAYSAEGVVDILRDIDHISLEYDYPKLSDIVHFNGRTLCFVSPSACWSNVERVEDAESVSIPVRGFSDYTSVMDSRDGHRVSSCAYMILCKQWHEYESQKCESQKFMLEYEMNEQAFILGYSNFQDALTLTVPYVPDSTRAVCKYLRIFNRNKDTILSLRPMYFSYQKHDNQAPFSSH